MRSRSFRGAFDEAGIRRILSADTLWGLAALVWISTGLLRAFGGLEKGSAYYLGNSLFAIKMALLVIILALEAWPMATLIGWRIRRGRGETIELDPRRKNLFATISVIQAGLVVGMVFAAAGMARGLGN